MWVTCDDGTERRVLLKGIYQWGWNLHNERGIAHAFFKIGPFGEEWFRSPCGVEEIVEGIEAGNTAKSKCKKCLRAITEGKRVMIDDSSCE